MPRYYFHVQDGSSLPDDTGSEFPNIEAAKLAAIDFAGSLLREGIPAGIWNGETWQLYVTDSPVIGEGRTFCTLSFSGSDEPK